MSLQRYGEVLGMLDECDDGDFVFLDDVIKLLESERTFPLFAFHVYGDGNPDELVADLIALIKGEK
jgi:hypothetical protein